MKSVVLLRAVPDPELARGVWGDICCLDEPSFVALGQAFALRDISGGGMVTGIAMGPPEWDPALKDALALGLDSVVRTWADRLAEADIPETATSLAEVIPEDTDVVFAGSAATDHGSGVLPAALAELLGWRLLTEVIDVAPAGGGLVAQVRAGGGRRRQYLVPLPAILVMARLPAPPLYPRLARRLASRRGAIPQRTPGPPVPANGTAGRLELLGYGPARPLTRHLLRPSANARPAERLRQLMSGGMAGRGGKTLDAASEGGVTRQLADILAQEGLLPHDDAGSGV